MYQIHSCTIFSDKMFFSFVCVKTRPEMKTKLMIQLILYSFGEEEKIRCDEDYNFSNKGNIQGPGNS